jgi:hypothetical protein
MFFRNADAAEAPAAAAVEQQPFNLMAEMAKAGRINNGEGGEIPKYTPPTPVADDEPSATPAVAAIEAPETPTEAVVGVTETPKAEVVEPPIATPEPPQVDWKEFLKKEQPKTVLTELGFDEKMVNFLEYWKSGGDVQQYLKELTTDYNEMPAEELMKHQLRREYPNANDRQLELLYKREVVDKFQLDPERFDEEQVEEGKLLLDAYASKYRQDFVKEQQSKLLAPAPGKAAPEVDPAIAEQQRLVESAKNQLVGSDLYRKVLENNALVVGDGEEAFKFPLDAKELPDIIYDSERFAESLFTIKQENGKAVLVPDVEKQMLVAAVAKHGMKIIVELAKHYKAVGSQKAINPIENPSPTGQPASATVRDSVPDTPAGMLAKFGRLR